MGIGSVLVNLVAKAMIFAIYIFVYQFRLFDIPYGRGLHARLSSRGPRTQHDLPLFHC